MKYCGKCGMQLEDDDQFCTGCGSKVGAVNAIDSGKSIVPGNPVSASNAPVAPAKTNRKVKIKIIIGAFLAILIVAGGFWGWNTLGTEARIQGKLDLAVKYLSENDYEKAILAFNDAVQIDPQEVKAYQGLARIYNIQGQYAEAKSTYDRGLAAVTAEKKPTLQIGLAGMYMDQGKLDSAEQAFQELIDSSKNCLEAYWGLAMIYQQKGDQTKAEAILRKAVENNPGEYRPYNTLALYLKQNSKSTEAFAAIEKSLSMEMNQQEVYLVISDLYKDKWAELRTKAAKSDNPQVAAMLEFYSYFAVKDYKKAASIYDEKLVQQTGNQKARIFAAIAMCKTEDKASADKIIAQLLKEKINGWLLSDLATYYVEAGEQKKAKDYALKALQANPSNLEAVAVLQTINSSDANAKVYTAQALLYNWKPVGKVKEDLRHFSLTIYGSTNSTAQSQYGNTPGNIVNFGYICQQGSIIYYRNTSDGEKLYKISSDGSGKIKLNDDKSRFINVIGDWIYYGNESDGGKIYRIHSDGSGREKVSDDKCGSVNVVGDWIYFWSEMDGRRIYKMRSDGSGREKLSDDGSDSVIVAGDWIYYNNSSGGYKIYKMRLDGSERVKLNNDQSWDINVVGDWIYYNNADSKNNIYKIRLDGSNRTKVNSDISHFVNVRGDWIYYQNMNDGWTLYKIRNDGYGRVKLSSDRVSNINRTDTRIYYCNWEDKYNVYKVGIDGSDKQIMN